MGNVRLCPHAREIDYVNDYVAQLPEIVDLDRIAASGLKIRADALGGSSARYWNAIAERYHLDITVVNDCCDPTFSFMHLDHDGRIRIDCSSPCAMRGFLAGADRFDLACANDPDADRHGIVTKSSGLMNSNHYLAVMADHLFRTRSDWPHSLGIGRTMVTSEMLDRIAQYHGRHITEHSIGFKWFVEGLVARTLGVCGEESAGAVFVRKNGSLWSTDKDGIICGLLAAEIMASAGHDPGMYYQKLEDGIGPVYWSRIDRTASWAEQNQLLETGSGRIDLRRLLDEPILSMETVSRDGASFRGVKVRTKNGWFVATPNEVECFNVYFAESFVSEEHRNRLLESAYRLQELS